MLSPFFRNISAFSSFNLKYSYPLSAFISFIDSVIVIPELKRTASISAKFEIKFLSIISVSYTHLTLPTNSRV